MPKSAGDELKDIRKALGLAQEKFAEMLGVNRGAYKNWEYNQSAPPKAIMQKALEVFRKSSISQSEIKPISLMFGPLGQIPVVGSVAAGEGNTNVDHDERTIWVPRSLSNIGGIGYIVDGESMMPSLHPGDIAVFSTNITPRRGFTFLIRTPDDQVRCKLLDWKDNQWTMSSLNPEFKDEQLGSSQLLGLLVGWYRSIGSYEKLEADPHGLRL